MSKQQGLCRAQGEPENSPASYGTRMSTEDSDTVLKGQEDSLMLIAMQYPIGVKMEQA